MNAVGSKVLESLKVTMATSIDSVFRDLQNPATMSYVDSVEVAVKIKLNDTDTSISINTIKNTDTVDSAIKNNSQKEDILI